MYEATYDSALERMQKAAERLNVTGVAVVLIAQPTSAAFFGATGLEPATLRTPCARSKPTELRPGIANFSTALYLC
jgi:hypothetical protein